GNLFVVDSVMSILRDGQYATQVKYYTDGINDLKTAIFTEDSINALGYSDEFETLSKGSVFTAITDANGLVNCYAVITSLDYHGVYDLVGDLKPLTQSIYGISEVNCKGDGVEFVYGYITNIRGKTITLGGTLPAGYTGDISADSFENGRDFVINARTAQYCYNTEGVKPKIVVGDYLSTGVDVYDDGKANLVLLKVYDDEVIDIISFSRRMIAPEIGIVAQTHYTGPALDIN
ncbi:MAG: hypothetical protein IJ365_03505, partial [Clostridia bacterium]|nr:hypothetical protein [Clostridia bacterium]